MMSSTNRKPADVINYWIKYIDCALSHPQPLPVGKHVFRSDLDTVPEVRDLYDCLFKLYSEEIASGPFREPVNALQHKIFTYFDTVREPMSLRTVLDRIAEGYYSDASQVMRDVDVIWSNCAKFNGDDSSIAAGARECRTILKRLREWHADEQEAPVAEVEQFSKTLEDLNNADLLTALEDYFRREEPSLLLPSGDLCLETLKVKHFKAMKDIMAKITKSGR